jgi:uncharacterized protein (TIGR03067 family)
MKRVFGLMIFLTACLAAADPAPGGDARADARKMQGTWSVVKLTVRDKAEPASGIRSMKLVFDKDTIAVKGRPGVTGKQKFKLAVAKGIGQIDKESDGGLPPLLGIYKFEKGLLVISSGAAGDARPTKFDGPEAEVLVLKRDAE